MTKTKNGKIRLEDRKFNWEVDVKEEFLESKRTSTARTIKSILLKVDEYEESIEKSVYDFNLDERDDFLLTKFSNKSKGTVRSTISYISDYINFCINKNLVKHQENRFSLILSSEIENYVNTQAMKMKYLTKEERIRFQDSLKNPNDKLILELIPLGVRGRTEKNNTNEELINLTNDDAYNAEKTRQLVLRNNDGEERIIENLEDRTIELLIQTAKQKEYILNNGSNRSRKRNDIILSRGMGEKSFPIIETDYLFKVCGKGKADKVRPEYFNVKLNAIRCWIENPYINVTNLYFSGLIDYAKKIKEKKGEDLVKEDYINIIDHFDYGKPTITKTGEKDWSNVVFKIKTMIEDYFKLKDE
jgi:hypothetical protein